MSIPKEPRQLMINVMYLVLTALLALNVSAEVFNAFAMVDKGLKTANTTLDASNEPLPEAIKAGAKKNDKFATYAARVDKIREISKENSAYISGLVDKLIDESGDRNGKPDDGDYVLNGGIRELKGKRDYDATTRLMVKSGEGEKLKAKMLETRAKFLALVDEGDRATFNLPIEIDDKTWKESTNPKENWADFTFGHMPVGATQPIFSKFINDTKSSEAALLNYLSGKVGLAKEEIVLDKFRVVSAPRKSYILRGEKYEADVFLSASAGQGNKTGISIAVNGQRLSTDADGVAKYSAVGSALGKKTYTATASVTNPVTGKTDTYKSEFEYEVGEKSATVSASKMNVFYIGVDNPVEISVAGASSNQINVSMTGGTINKSGNGTYNVRASSVGNATVSVSAPGMNYSKEFRVKRIPDPVPVLGKHKGGKIGDGEFKAYPGVFPLLENFDFDARCEITDFLLVRAPKRQDPEFSPNSGGRYNGKSQDLVNKAAPGDNYLFQDIKCKCPGDGASRAIGSMVFSIR
jgi:gliding motility-associated protein GldM